MIGAWEDGPLSVDVRAELAAIIAGANAALEALHDEREGDFARRAVDLHTHAAAVLHVVATW